MMSEHLKNLSWIAVDWGTSKLRVWLLDSQNNILFHICSDHGAARLNPEQFEDTLLELIGDSLPAQGSVPVICCGAVGAQQGWAEAPYIQTPCPPPSFDGATQIRTKDHRLQVFILPGIKQPSPADVMRGEETQIAGFLSETPNFDGVIYLPGTHSKWAHISANEVVSFRSFMTGELFALACKNSVLRHSVADTGWDDEAFKVAVADAMSRPSAFAANLFSIRAETLLSKLSGATARARLSGQLIGIELAAARPYWLGQEVVIVGANGIATAYQTALAEQVVQARIVPAKDMSLNGLLAAYANRPQ